MRRRVLARHSAMPRQRRGIEPLFQQKLRSNTRNSARRSLARAESFYDDLAQAWRTRRLHCAFLLALSLVAGAIRSSIDRTQFRPFAHSSNGSSDVRLIPNAQGDSPLPGLTIATGPSALLPIDTVGLLRFARALRGGGGLDSARKTEAAANLAIGTGFA